MTNAFASAIFCARNVDKTKHGEIGRSAVALGQAKRVVDSIMKIDGKIGRGATKAVETVINFSNKSKALQAVGQGINYASNHINPLICVSSGIKVAISDDKKKTLINETGAISGMLLTEKLAKKVLGEIFDSKTVTQFCENGMKAAQTKGYKNIGKLIKASPAIVKGGLFVLASISGYGMGLKLAKKISSKQKTEKDENIFAKAPQSEQKVQNKAPEKIEKVAEKEEVTPKKVDIAA